MLVLTRRLDESLVIGENIVVKVLAIEGDKVKLGIEAPREISILRNELYQAVVEQGLIASRLASGPEPESFQKLRALFTTVSQKTEKDDQPPQKADTNP